MKLNAKDSMGGMDITGAKKPKLPMPLVSKLVVSGIAVAGIAFGCRSALYTDSNLPPASLSSPAKTTAPSPASSSLSSVTATSSATVVAPPEPCIAGIVDGKAGQLLSGTNSNGVLTGVTLNVDVGKNKHLTITLPDPFSAKLQSNVRAEGGKAYLSQAVLRLQRAALVSIGSGVGSTFDCEGPISAPASESSAAPAVSATAVSSAKPVPKEPGI